MKHKIKRVIIGSILTIATITLVAVLLQWLFGIGSELQQATTKAMAVIAPIVSSIILLVWGIPVYLILSKFNKYEIWWYVLAGFIPAPIFVFLFKPMGNDPIQYLLSQSLYFGIIGTLGAITFWVFVVKMLHNKSAQSNA